MQSNFILYDKKKKKKSFEGNNIFNIDFEP
jgi:hypothetical protein